MLDSSRDNASCLVGALGWLQRFPYVGESHWPLRHTAITIPTALSVAALGLNELAVVLPNVLYVLAFLILNGYFITRYIGRQAAISTLLWLITMPGFLVVSTYLKTDIPDLFFLSAAFWALNLGFEFPRRMTAWLATGTLSALAFLTRKTSAVFLLFRGILFLIHPVV
jgi:4-amino-4-deoxy-L-arabinose transferase-like glycosyltransferase